MSEVITLWMAKNKMDKVQGGFFLFLFVCFRSGFLDRRQGQANKSINA